MATIKQDYAASAAVTISLNSLASGTAVLSSEIDNATANKYLAADIEINANWATGTPNGTLDVYLVKSADGTTFADTAELSNLTFLCSVTPDSVTNTNTVTKVIRVEQLPNKWKILAKNTDTLALGASGNSINYVGVSLTNA